MLKRLFFVRELNLIITHTKGHYGWKNLNQISKAKKVIEEDSKEKSHKHQNNEKGMGMRNKRMHLSNLVTIMWSDIQWQPKDKGEMNFIFWPQESYQDS